MDDVYREAARLMEKVTYQPKHFEIREVLPEDFYYANVSKYGAYLWTMFDERILMAADMLRDRYGSMICNDWAWGGPINYRGWRPFDYGEGAPLSQHKFGRALDLVPLEVSAEEIREDMSRNNTVKFWGYIKRVENDTAWLHIDCANTGRDEILFFNP